MHRVCGSSHALRHVVHAVTGSSLVSEQSVQPDPTVIPFLHVLHFVAGSSRVSLHAVQLDSSDIADSMHCVHKLDGLRVESRHVLHSDASLSSGVVQRQPFVLFISLELTHCVHCEDTVYRGNRTHRWQSACRSKYGAVQLRHCESTVMASFAHKHMLLGSPNPFRHVVQPVALS